MTKKVLSVLLLSSLSLLSAQESIEMDLDGFDMEEEASPLDGFDDELDGFAEADEEEPLEQKKQKEEEPSNFSLLGNIAFKTAYAYREHSVDGVNYKGLNQAQSALYLQVDYKINKDWKLRVSGDAFYDAIYSLRDQPYNQDVLDSYETQLRFDDTYLQGRLGSDIDITLGRQVVVWGKSDNIRITDVINPLDNRLPGLTDIEDLRLPTGMLKVDYYTGKWNLSAMAIFESRIFLEAAPYGEYFPVGNIFPSAPNPFFSLVDPQNSSENMQYAFAANGIFSGWDLSFYAADVYDSKWHIEGTNLSNAKRVVSKVQMLGSAYNIVAGSWLFKSEVALLSGVKYNATLDEKNRLDTLIGFDYMGFKDTTLSVELANRHIFDHEAIMASYDAPKPDYVDQNELQTALRLTHSMMNDTLDVTALVSMFGASWEYGGFTRVWLEYELMNALNATLGVVDYIGGEKPFMEATKENDRLFADITYSF